MKILKAIVAFIFIFASCAKLFGTIHDLVYFEYAPITIWFDSIVILAEVSLGMLVFVCWRSVKVWGCVLVFSLALTLVTLGNVMTGVADCGCLGVVRSQPIQMLAVDVFLVLSSLTALKMIPFGEDQHAKSISTTLIQSTLFVFLMTGFFAFAFYFNLGKELIAVRVQPIASTLSNEKVAGAQVLIQVRNKSEKQFEIVGIKTPCKTVFDISLPIVIEAGSSAYLPVRTEFPNGTNFGNLSFQLYSGEFDSLSRLFSVRIFNP